MRFLKLSKFLGIACCAVLFMAAFSVAGPVSHFGYLQTCKISNKGQLCGSLTGTSTAVMVKGPSLYWSTGQGTTFYNRQTVDWFVDNMQIGIIRAAMAIKWYKENSQGISKQDGSTCESCFGYLSTGFPNAKTDLKKLIQNVIDAAVANDIYVIVDWHSHNANSEKSEAVAFFRDMATANKDVPNIIWEIYNEPVSDDASTIKNYANDVIAAIRGAGNKNLVIVGSNYYSQKPKQQADAGITDSENNTAYSFHFYSKTHSYSETGDIGGSANSARNAGHAVYATEWGSVNADGSGTPDFPTNWVNFMDGADIGGCYWSASEIAEGASIFKNGTTVADLLAGKVSEVLTSSGDVFKTYMNTKKWTSYIPSGNPKGNDVAAIIAEGAEKTWTTELGLTGTIKEASLLDGTGEVAFTSNSITYTSLPWNSSSQAYIVYTVTNGTKDVKQRAVVTLKDFKPSLPQKDPIAVSRKAPNYIRLLSDLGATDRDNKALSFSAVSVSGGATVEIVGSKSDSIKFTPPASAADAELTTFELTYSVKNTANLTSTQTVTLNAQNMPPTLANNQVCCSRPNTDAFDIPIRLLGGKDLDGDSLWFVAYYLDPGYPGTLELIAPDTLRYTPDPSRKGTIRILSVVTDGLAESNLGNSKINLTGNGTDIVDQNPTEIPGFTPIARPILQNGSLSLQTFGNGKLLVSLAKSGIAGLDIYSISGKKAVSLMNGNQSAGFYEFNLSNLQKGVYIVRLKQGSELKVQRIAIH